MYIIEDFGGVWEYNVSYVLKYFSFKNISGRQNDMKISKKLIKVKKKIKIKFNFFQKIFLKHENKRIFHFFLFVSLLHYQYQTITL